MPNIIEQQDLLKGLPDNRLAMMMQNPTGDIPPFLVAAEAQRRQSIRQQFSGGPQESVVDTLTKQMANVPQNIQAPAQMPPQMPPPQMQQMPQQMPQQGAGVAALQGQQQAMRRGGMVQRYQDGSLVTPSVQSMAASITGMTPEEYMRQKEAERIAALGPGKAKYLLQNPTVPTTESEIAAQEFKAATEGPFSSFYSPQSVYEAAQAVTNPATPSRTPVITGMTAEERQMMQRAPTASPAFDPRDPSAGKKETSTNNQAKTDISVDEYKKYLEDIYGVRAEDSEYIRNKIKEMYSSEEPSGWESAQKWFAAAQAAIQPGQTNMQSAINALSTLGSGYAEERAAERASRRDMEEALLKQDIADRQAAGQSDRDIAKAVLDFKLAQEERDRAARSSAYEAQLGGYTKQADYAMKKAEMYARLSSQEQDKLDSLVSDLRKSGMVSEEEISRNPEVQRLLKRIGDINTLQQNALAESKLGMERYGEKTGSELSFETADGVNPIRPGQ